MPRDDVVKIDVSVESPVHVTPRVRQLEAMFDVPPAEKSRLSWQGDVDVESQAWNVGLIVGPSGSGKSTLMRTMFGGREPFSWHNDRAVIDDFAPDAGMSDIAATCQAVGFNTIPAWMRPFSVLSTGEKFRVELARHLLETPSEETIVVDEFTSVVDRQVAQIGSHAVQKYVRKNGRRFVAASCHYDIVDWLQPDWTFEPATMSLARRSLQRRPSLDIEISRVDYPTWRLFAPFHYLTANLHRAARCFVLFVNGRPASFAGMLYRPHPRSPNIFGCSRLVTLPDWQGLGLAMVLIERLGACYRALGQRLHTYPAHPSLIHAFQKSSVWQQERRAGTFSARNRRSTNSQMQDGGFGGRPCGVFEYRGEIHHDRNEANELINGTARDDVRENDNERLRRAVLRSGGGGSTRRGVA